MADGSRKALMEVQVGDVVKSWDSETNSSSTSTVLDVPKYKRESLMELRLETGDVIYSTDDHPYWSHRKESMVSRDPNSTLSLYGFDANQLDDEEVFEDEDGKPVAGRVSLGRRTASVIMDGVEILEAMEVMTLRLKGSHWFYVQGIRVHNKSPGEPCKVGVVKLNLVDQNSDSVTKAIQVSALEANQEVDLDCPSGFNGKVTIACKEGTLSMQDHDCKFTTTTQSPVSLGIQSSSASLGILTAAFSAVIC